MVVEGFGLHVYVVHSHVFSKERGIMILIF